WEGKRQGCGLTAAHMFFLPRLYPILDASCFSDSDALLTAAEDLVSAGVSLVQYRDKSEDAQVVLAHANELRRRSRIGVSAPHGLRLILNDRADLCLAAQFDGVHVGQDDLSPESARSIIGIERWLGVSTHNPQQVADADKTSANYIAVGPVF